MQEDVRGGDLDPPSPRRARDPDTGERVAADLEEVVRRADRVNAEHGREDLGEHDLHGSSRGPGRCAGVHVALGRRGERSAVHLSAAVARQRLEGYERRRHHVRRQHAAEVGRKLGCRHGAAGFRDHVGDQPLAVGAVVAGHDDGLPYRGVGVEGRLDLARLDPHTAHLDLLVEAAEELESAIRAEPHLISRPVQPASGLIGERMWDEPLRGESGPCSVAPRQPRAPEVELAGQAYRNPLEPLVQRLDSVVRRKRPDHRRVIEVREIRRRARDDRPHQPLLVQRADEAYPDARMLPLESRADRLERLLIGESKLVHVLEQAVNEVDVVDEATEERLGERPHDIGCAGADGRLDLLGLCAARRLEHLVGHVTSAHDLARSEIRLELGVVDDDADIPEAGGRLGTERVEVTLGQDDEPFSVEPVFHAGRSERIRSSSWCWSFTKE